MWEIFYRRIYPWEIELLGDQRDFESMLSCFLDIWWLLSYCEVDYSENVSRIRRILVTPEPFWSFVQVCLFFLPLALTRCNYNSHYDTITCCSGGCISISVIVDLEAADWINSKHEVSISVTTKAQSVCFHTARQMSRFPPPSPSSLPHLHPQTRSGRAISQ